MGAEGVGNGEREREWEWERERREGEAAGEAGGSHQLETVP